MLALARMIDEESRSLRKIVEAAGEIKRQAHAEITQAVFASEGEGVYPDATFTLRLAYGTVKGYEDAGKQVPAITTYAGLFERARSKGDSPPFDLPPRWEKLRPQLERDDAFLKTPFNFVSTADIIGGNSGSPVVNTAGELVGLIFDGNIQSLVLDIAYDDTQARAVSVDAAGILAALRTVYAADTLVAELLHGGGAGWLRHVGRREGRWLAAALRRQGTRSMEADRLRRRGGGRGGGRRDQDRHGRRLKRHHLGWRGASAGLRDFARRAAGRRQRFFLRPDVSRG
jgi:hypothetical protein